MSGPLDLHQAKQLSNHHHQLYAADSAAAAALLVSRSRNAAANRPAVPLPNAAAQQSPVRVAAAATATNDRQLLISRALGSATVGPGPPYQQQQSKQMLIAAPATISGQQQELLAASSQQQLRYQELLAQQQRMLNNQARLATGSNSDFSGTSRPASAQMNSNSGYRTGSGGGGSSTVVQTLPRSQTAMNQIQPQIHQEFTHQTLPSKHSTGRSSSQANQVVFARPSGSDIAMQQQRTNYPQQHPQQLSQQLLVQQQQYPSQQQQQQIIHRQQQMLQQQQQQIRSLQQDHQQLLVQKPQPEIQLRQQQQQQQKQYLLQQQQLIQQKQQSMAEQQQQQQQQMLQALANMRLTQAEEEERTYMNVQPVAVVGRNGKLLKPGEARFPPALSAEENRKLPIIPKSTQVKNLLEPLYCTLLQAPQGGSGGSAADQTFGNKVLSPTTVFEDTGLYANYAPASLYSNYSNYSELEALRSTDSQCSGDEEPGEGLPNLGDSPVSSSYSELRQARGPPTFSGNGALEAGIYEPVLPPKGVSGHGLIHYKSLSNSSSDSDYFGCCVECGGRIVGEGAGCSAMGRLFHIQCFVCTECGCLLQGLPFYAVEGKALCERDYTNTLEKCCKCFNPILDRILRATGKPYHPTCFTCVACNKSLDGIPFTVDATNQIHCIEDFHRKFAPRCSVCQEPIMPTPGQEETVRVVALDRSFHLECYRCVDCNLLLSSEEEGRGCYPLDNNVLCKLCNTRRIQALTSRITPE